MLIDDDVIAINARHILGHFPGQFGRGRLDPAVYRVGKAFHGRGHRVGIHHHLEMGQSADILSLVLGANMGVPGAILGQVESNAPAVVQAISLSDGIQFSSRLKTA